MAIAVKVPPPEVVQAAEAAYERGQYVDALAVAEAFAPLPQWGGVEGCNLAGRIAMNMGAPRLASRLAVRAWRTDKTHPEAQLQFGLELVGQRGPLALWLAFREWPLRPEATPLQQAELLALKASTAAASPKTCC